MKKNKLFILGLVTVFVALVSLTLVSSTWAKYTSSATGSDSARVAYWGYNDTSSILLDELFMDAYDATVDGAANVIAPGTTKSATFKFANAGAISASPETSYRFTVSVDDSVCAPEIANNPNIRWTLQSSDTDWGNSLTPGMKTDLDWGTLLAEIKLLSGEADGSCDYAPEAALPTLVNKTWTVTWNWAFSTSESADSYDTGLGNSASPLNVTLKITISAVQID